MMLPELSPIFFKGDQHGLVGWQSKLGHCQENQYEFVQVFAKEVVHHIHKLGRGIGNTEWHD